MPKQDPNLYGQRAPKKQRREVPISSSLDFTSQLTSLLSTTTSSGSAAAAATTSSFSTGRARPSKSANDALSNVKVKRRTSDKPRAAETTHASSGDGNRIRLKSPIGTEDDKNEYARARRKMQEKAKLYASMKRGDVLTKEGDAAPLVDFDRKWAEAREAGQTSDTSSEEDDEDDEGQQQQQGKRKKEGDDDDDEEEEDDYKDTEVIEFTDEFGRQRRGTRAEKLRFERRQRRGELSAQELEGMSARPRAPENIIYGDAVQIQAFRPDDPEAMAALARKRDRSLTPPPATHYEADKEIRTKGTGFYAFSKDESTRMEEMASLEAERARTENVRREREEKLAARRRELEERRREIGERRAKKMADSFLDGLGQNLTTTKDDER